MPRALRICLFESAEGKRCVHRVPASNRLGYCDEHKPVNAEPWKRTTDYGPRLPNSTLRAILKRDPYCYDPHGYQCKAKSTDVDHVIARWEGGSDRLSNLKGVCNPCHRRKSAMEGVRARKKNSQND